MSDDVTTDDDPVSEAERDAAAERTTGARPGSVEWEKRTILMLDALVRAERRVARLERTCDEAHNAVRNAVAFNTLDEADAGPLAVRIARLGARIAELKRRADAAERKLAESERDHHEACDHVVREHSARLVLDDRIRRALLELGVPQPGYPAPVANAVAILRGEAFADAGEGKVR